MGGLIRFHFSEQVTQVIPAVVEACRSSNTICCIAIGGAANRGFKNCLQKIGNDQ
jgi:hypothetical protein